MTKILIVYATDYGNTKKMAEAVAEGAKSVENCEAIVKAAEDVTAEDMTSSDGVIVGSPTHMGSPDWRVKKFIDTVCSGLWMKDAMVGRVGAVFATGSGFGNTGGGSEVTMIALLNNFAELGMIMIPLPKNTPGYKLSGLQWGAYARSADANMTPTGVPDEQLEAARHHGANVARAATVLKGNTIFAR
ncbi:MAG: flavodoxin domain-containing protein [Pyrinomonadaceae bacterium]